MVVAQSRKMTMSAVFRSLLHLGHDQRGIAAVTVAITLPLLFAFGALAINSGLWFTIKRQNQSAADAAALSAAYEVLAGNTDVANNLIPAATEAATPPHNRYAGDALMSGGPSCAGSGSLVCYPYTDSYVSNGVAVILQQNQSSLFAYAPLASATIATKAVAVVKKLADACILALDPTAQPNALSLSNNASLVNASCGVASNSTAANALSLSNNATINGPVSVVGGWSLSNGAALNGSPNLQGAPAIPDPYSSLTLPSLPACPTGLNGTAQNNVTVDLIPGRYCGGWDFKNIVTVNLAAGTYYIDTKLSIKNDVTVNATLGVTIVVNGNYAIDIGNNAILNITAPAPGSGQPFPGMAIMDLSTTTNVTQVFDNSTTMNIKGAVYFRNQIIDFQNNASSPGGCTQIIGRLIHLSNNVYINDNCSGVGTNPLTINTVALAG
jgi:Flp pilus assembly protein TadG